MNAQEGLFMAGRRHDPWTWFAVILLALLPVAAAWPAGAAPPAHPMGGDLVSGVEGSKAALVRIEVTAQAEIVHIDHTSGEVALMRGRYTVPIRTATGVFVSSDGTIATAGHTLTVTADQVVVYAANKLFEEELGVTLVGNDGDPSRRAQTADPHWAMHLQDCYDQTEHCILFFVPHYRVVPYTEDPVGTPADVLSSPKGPADPGLLRISGGGGTPTAQLAAADEEVVEHGLLIGFTDPPAPGVAVVEMGVEIDAAAGTLSPEGDMGSPDAGLAGGPVVDPDTGEVVGLDTSVDGTETMIPAQALRDALAAAGVEPSVSQFDAVFRRGVDHLANGHAAGSAVNSFDEARHYYDSALAVQYLEEAQAAGGTDEMAAPPTNDDRGLFGSAGFWIALGMLVLLALALALFLRRRRASGRGSSAAADPTPPAPTAAAPRPKHAKVPAADGGPQAGEPAAAGPTRTPSRDDGSRERTQLRQSPARVPAMVPAALKETLPASRPAPTYCSDCGGALRERARFCGSCGSPVA
jgi:hypothetical protein